MLSACGGHFWLLGFVIGFSRFPTLSDKGRPRAQAYVDGALLPGVADLVPLLGGGTSTFSLPINAPGTVRAPPACCDCQSAT